MGFKIERTQKAEQTPFDNSSNGFSASDSQAAIEEARNTFNGFTTGSIPFASGSSVITQNNINFFWDNTNTRLGVGIASPSVKLVALGSEANNTLGAGVNSAIKVVNTNTGAAGRLAEVHFGISNSTNYAAISGYLTNGSNNTQGDVVVATRVNPTDTNLTEAVRVLASGNVGVGTSSPARKLVVNGATSPLWLSVRGPNASTAGILFGSQSSDSTGRVVHDNSTSSMQIWTNNAQQINIASNGGFIGYALHTAGGTGNASSPGLGSRRYTPALTNVANNPVPTVTRASWFRVGNMVTVTVLLASNPQFAAANTSVGIALPVASAFSNFADCIGTGVSKNGLMYGYVEADVVNDRATYNFISDAGAGNELHNVVFTYEVI